MVAQNKFVIFETEKQTNKRKRELIQFPPNKAENIKFYVESSFESLCPKKLSYLCLIFPIRSFTLLRDEEVRETDDS